MRMIPYAIHAGSHSTKGWIYSTTTYWFTQKENKQRIAGRTPIQVSRENVHITHGLQSKKSGAGAGGAR